MTALLTLCCMPETNSRRQPLSSAPVFQFFLRLVGRGEEEVNAGDVEPTDTDAAPAQASPATGKRQRLPTSEEEADCTDVVEMADVGDAKAIGSPAEAVASAPVNIAPQPSPRRASNAAVQFGIAEAFAMPYLRSILLTYLCLAAHDIIFAEVYPLWAVLQPREHGLGYSVAQVGLTTTVSGVVGLATNLGLPKLRSIISDRAILLWANVSYIVTYLVVPQLWRLAADPAEKSFVTASMVVLLTVRVFPMCMSYSVLSILFARAAPRRVMGRVLAVAQTLASYVRLVVPPLITFLFAWSAQLVRVGGAPDAPELRTRPFPFDSSLSFIVCAALSGFALYLELAKSTDGPPVFDEDDQQ
jgi:hypothetical protein